MLVRPGEGDPINRNIVFEAWLDRSLEVKALAVVIYRHVEFVPNGGKLTSRLGAKTLVGSKFRANVQGPWRIRKTELSRRNMLADSGT